MLESLETVRMSQAMMSHAGQRSKMLAGNVANADTPGYLARDLRPFAETYRDSAAMPMRATRAQHFSSTEAGGFVARIVEERDGRSPNGNSVSLEDEMFRTAEIKRQHELSLAVYKSSLTMLRAAMGRRG